MRVFVASWFFPPSTSSEGIVTYKLLHHSAFQYDVVSSSSNLWGYAKRFETDAENIRVIPIDTDDLNEWRDRTVELFRTMNAETPYDAFMTRCMPNESLEIGLKIKEEYPNLKWICSLADPVANNPYWLYAISNIPDLNADEKKAINEDLKLPRAKWRRNWLDHPSNSIRDQFYWKNIQDQALQKADMIITPSIEQRDYMDPEKTAWSKFLIVPHSYDEDLNRQADTVYEWDKNQIHFVYTGYSDTLRSLIPFVNAVHYIHDRYPTLLDKIKIHFFGNYPREIIDRAYAFQVADVFDFQGNVSYLETLALMKQADWLLHVDAYFEYLPGGSIFFAGKLADYMGAGKPILALTGEESPAGMMVAQYGGIRCMPWEITRIANAFISIANGTEKKSVTQEFRTLFSADNVAKNYDGAVKTLAEKIPAPAREVVIDHSNDSNKALTICVPSFNAQSTLRRTLDTLLKIEHQDKIQIIVVDDGSQDSTAEIGREYTEKYPESVVLVSKTNGGHGSGINYGLKLAKGHYFRVVDSDDWVDSDALNAEVEYILTAEKHPDIIYTPYHIVYQDTGLSVPWPLSNKIEFNRIYGFDDLINQVGVEDVYFTMAATSFRTDLLKEMSLQLKEKSFYTDSAFILKPIPFTNTVVFLKKAVYKYLRGQSEQSVAPLSFVRHYEDHEAIVRELIEYEMHTQMSKEQHRYMRYILEEHLKTNYQILLEFDPDPEHGIEKAKAFDNWLHENARDYYESVPRVSVLAKALRQANYSVSAFLKAKKSTETKKIPLKKRLKRKAKRLLFSKLFKNRYTMKFIRRQKDTNGLVYRMYMRAKKAI